MPVPAGSIRFLLFSAACFVAASASIVFLPFLAMGLGWLEFNGADEAVSAARFHQLEIALPAILALTGVVLIFCHLRRRPAPIR